MSYAIGIILLLWPLEIGPEEMIPVGQGEKVVKKEIPENKKKTVKVGDSNKKYRRSKIVTKKVISIDKELFLIKFQRQARLGLLKCLQNWKPSPSSAILSGRLYREGQLRQIRSVDASNQFPECVRATTRKMTFPVVSKELPKLGWQAIQWKIDW